MMKVTRTEFWEFVNPRDICVYCVKTYPIAVTEFKTRSGVLIGKSTHDYAEEVKEYFLIETAEQYSAIVED